MLFDKEDLKVRLNKIAQEIMTEIICPMIGNQEEFFADMFLADINMMTLGNMSMNEAIMVKICGKYGLSSMDEEEFIPPLDACHPLVCWALLILLEGDYDDKPRKKGLGF